MLSVEYNHLKLFHNLSESGAVPPAKAQQLMVEYLHENAKKSEDAQKTQFNPSYVHKFCMDLTRLALANQERPIVTAIEEWKNQWLKQQGIALQAAAPIPCPVRASEVPPVAQKMPQLRLSSPSLKPVFIQGYVAAHVMQKKPIQEYTEQDLLHALSLKIDAFLQYLEANEGLEDSYAEWKGENGETIAHLAAQVSSQNVLRYLHENGIASFDESDGDKKNCMHYAVKHNNTDAIDFLLESGNSDLLFRTDSEGYSPLHHTILNKATTNLIIMLWKTWQQLESVTSHSGDNELHLAAKIGFLPAFSMCLLHPQFKSILTAENASGETPLQIAAKEGHLGIVRLICTFGEDRISQQDKEAALQLAVKHNHLLILEFLRKGEIANAPTYEDLKASPERMLEFINLGLDINGLQNGKSMLHQAIEDNSLPLVKQMIREGGALITVSANKGLPALYFAASLGRSEIVLYLNKTFYGHQSFLKLAYGHQENPMDLANRCGYGKEIGKVLANSGWS